MEYPVYRGNEEIGKAQMTACGLYYEIRCACRLDDPAIHRMTVSSGEKHADLGVLVPMADSFGLHTKVPIRTLGDGPFRFELDRKEEAEREFYPIIPEEPFGAIGQLKNAVLEIRDGVVGAAVI